LARPSGSTILLVGDRKESGRNARGLPAWSVTLVNAKNFDGYCKNGVIGQSSSEIYKGTLNAADHTFSNSTFVVFSGSNRQ
jgi:hypothetical protein